VFFEEADFDFFFFLAAFLCLAVLQSTPSASTREKKGISEKNEDAL